MMAELLTRSRSLLCDHGNHRNHTKENVVGAVFIGSEFPDLYAS